MVSQPPAARTSLDVAFWFKVRSDSAGQKLSQRKLQCLLYISQGLYAAKHKGRKLMPATFLTTDSGPIEPNLYQIFREDSFTVSGAELPIAVQTYLANIWDVYGGHSADQLREVVVGNGVWKQVQMKGNWVEVPHAIIIRSYGGNQQSADDYGNDVVVQELDPEREYWTLSGKKAQRWIPGVSKKTTRVSNKKVPGEN